MAGGLGINKDLEPLVRAVRRAGGAVVVTGSTHVRWTMPNGVVLRSGLTMSRASARATERQVCAALRGCGEEAPGRSRRFRIDPDGSGKFHLVDVESGLVVRNASGYPRTFSTETGARAAIRAGQCRGAS